MTAATLSALKANTLPTRVLGKTGEHVPILGLGTGPGGMGMKNAAAIELYHQAIDMGVTYIDTAPGYERAQEQLGEVLSERRDEVFVVTKTLTADGDRALEILEESLRTLRVEQVDLAFVHHLGGLDIDAVLSKGGSLAALREAQRRGWTRYVGFTSHNQPWKSQRVLEEAEVDAVMLAMNFVDRHTYNFEEGVLPLAKEYNVGVAAMKIYGGAKGMDYHPKNQPSQLASTGSHDHRQALQYGLGLPGVAIAVVGMCSLKELQENVEWARNFEPLSPEKEAGLLNQGKAVAMKWGPHYGPVK
ncbi:MAG: aldo/keto reductase [Planctomycetota bacterium]|nr:aldo/keto reductase [Planctomycetota bacterium]MDA1139207.1 aldo/keto reductase [Planctomycetota bacterium]